MTLSRTTSPATALVSEPLPTPEAMSLVVHLPEELARRVEAVAAGRDQSPEQVAIDAIEAQLPARRRLSFSGVGSSGASGGDIGRRHREVVADHFADKTARDV